ncbi:MAG: MmcQ/YjbR family DNA-binding protein [Pseudomonadota bacterium]
MFAELVERHCAGLPGAEPERPFGPDTLVWKVGGKMFAAYTEDGRGLSVKCQDGPTAQILIQQGRAESAPYLKRGGWVLFPWEQTAPDELRARLTDSYMTVRQGLSAEKRNALPPLPTETQH